MGISLDIPNNLAQQLAEEVKDLSKAALEALAIDAYQMERITGFSSERSWVSRTGTSSTGS